MLFGCLSPVSGEALPSKQAMTLISRQLGNVFPDDQGELKLIVSNTSPIAVGNISLNDERGVMLSTWAIPPGAMEVRINLHHKGFYAVKATAHFQDGTDAIATTTASVIGKPLGEKIRNTSRNGVWQVHGNLDLANVAGSRWTRQMWRLKDYQRDAGGKIIPLPKSQPLDKRFTWIGTLAWGLPQWFEGRPKHGKAIVKGDELFPPADWGQLDSVTRQFAEDVSDFPPIFELWNEPEINWIGKFDPNNLVKFHAVLAEAIKSVHPDTKLIGPCLWHVDLPHLKQLVDAGLLDHLDGISLHGYVNGATPPEGEFIGNIIELKRYLRSIGKEDMPLYLTEFGWSTGYGGTGPFVHVDELTQARYVSRALTLLYAQELEAAIHFALLFNSKKDTAEQSFLSGFSFLNKDETPKPAYASYANASKWLAGTSNPSWLKISPTTHLVMFDKGAKQIAVAWDAAGEQQVHLPQVVAAEGMMGQRITKTNSMTLSPSPSFIQFNKKVSQTFKVKPSISAHSGDVLVLNYEKLWLPNELRIQGVGRVNIPLHTEKGMYVVFAKRVDGMDVIPVVIGE